MVMMAAPGSCRPTGLGLYLIVSESDNSVRRA